MKKILLVFAAIVVLFIGAAIAIPIIFKDDIKAGIDQEIARSIDADVYFDTDKFGLSFFNNFPNLTVSMADFGVIGRHEFEDKVLMAVNKLEVTLNLKDLVFGDAIKINAIHLEQPQVFIKVLENGKANYDIFIASSEEEVSEIDSTTSDLAIQIDHWEINGGRIQYDDESLAYFMDLEGINHQGSGDFDLTLFDLDTKTVIDKTLISYEGINYLSNKKLDLDMLLNMDLDAMKFTFKENTLKINDFALGFEGFFSMPAADYEMDIKFNTKNTDIKTLYSLVPGAFKEGFDAIKSAGKLAFEGSVSGIYGENKMPTIALGLKVTDGMIQYPSLPNAIKGINIDLAFASPEGDMERSSLAINDLAMDFGGNPVKMKASIKNFNKPNVDADVRARLNLAEVNTLVPTEGLAMKGSFSIDLKAKGVYDTLSQKFPDVKANMSLKDGYFKYDEYPVPLEKVDFTTTIVNEGGSMEKTTIEMSNFNLLVDGEVFSGNLTLENLVDYHWDTQLKGKLDLDKITKIFPLDSMEIKGIIDANISSKGTMSAIERENYQAINTTGDLTINGFEFNSSDLAYAMIINKATAKFNPKSIELTSFDGKIGNSDMKVSGHITNYMNYIFKDNATIRGAMTYQANNLDVNQWMVTEGEVSEDTTAYETEVIEIPKNIDFTLAANIGNVDYDNMKIKNVKGDIIVRDGKVDMKGLNFNTLGGNFVMNGTYNTKNLEKPTFEFEIDMKDVSIKQSYSTFNTIKAFAPIAKFVDGNFSTKFDFNGELGADMMPKLGTISGAGLINVASAVLEQNKITSGLASLTGHEKIKTNALIKDLLLQTEIKDGKLNVKPYDIELAGFKTRISGSSGLDGNLDFNLLLDVPAGDYGAKLNSLVGNFTGKQSGSENVKLPVRLTQSLTDPKLTLGSVVSKDKIKDEVTEVAKTKLIEQITDNKGKIVKDSAVSNLIDSSTIVDTKKQLQAKKDSIKAAMAAKAKAQEDSLKKVADEAKKKASDKIKSLLKFKNNN